MISLLVSLLFALQPTHQETDNVQKYHVVLADPPWPEKGGGKRGAQHKFDVMSIQQIKRVGAPLEKHLADDCYLFMWVTNSFLEDWCPVVRDWGFRPLTLLTWVKEEVGLGQYTMGQTEHMVLAVRGSPGYFIQPDGSKYRIRTCLGGDKLKSPRGPDGNRIHSAKPPEVMHILEQALRGTPGPYLELFARKRFSDNWHIWGNQVDSDIDLELPFEQFGFDFLHSAQVEHNPYLENENEK